MILNLTVSFPGRDGMKNNCQVPRYAYQMLSMESLKKVIQIPSKINE